MKTGKKLLSIIFTLILLLNILPFGSVSAAGFSARLTAPTSDNAYYYANNQFYQWGYGMPNCTCYAYGRAYEILGSKPNLCTKNAGAWWSYNVTNGFYPYGQTPKLGAIAVWDKYDDNQGHVAVVEEINGSQVTISESHYSGAFFDTKTIKADSSDYLKSYRFRGYIYIIGNEPTTPPAAPYVCLSKSTLEVNETATVTWESSEGATSYWVTCWLEDELVINNENKSFSQVVSFEKPGTYYLTVIACNDVGETFSERIEITVNGSTVHQHSWNTEYTVDNQPTCAQKGSKSIHCKECSEKKNIIEISALGHSFGTWTTTKTATCTTEGAQKRTCSLCGKIETKAIPKTGHKVVTDSAVNPTCTTSGKTEGSHCSKCNAVITAQQTVSALGHSFGEWTVKIPATETKEGVEERTCHCGAKETKAIPKLNAQSVVSVAFDSKKIDTNYNSSFALATSIDVVGNPEYTVEYSSSNPKVATVDQNGNVKATGTGTATITVIVTDSDGNTFTDTCEVKVTYTFIQLLLYIICFGWLWM